MRALPSSFCAKQLYSCSAFVVTSQEASLVSAALIRCICDTHVREMNTSLDPVNGFIPRHGR